MVSQTRQVELVSATTSGTLGDYHSGYNSLAIGRDGNRVAFYTYAANLFSPDPYGSDYALKDMLTGDIFALTQSLNGSTLNGESGGAVAGYDTLSMSGNGQNLVFGSTANLLNTSDGSDEDIFSLSLGTDQLTMVSQAQGGTKTSHALSPDVSDNGRFIVFGALENLVAPNDINEISDTDVYWLDTASGDLRLVSGEFDGSVQGGGNNQEGDSWDAHVTNDGRFVVFQSIALNLRPGATGGGSKQLFLRDMVDDQLYLISTGSDSAPANSTCETPEITPDGRYVVFGSSATNLVANVSGWNIFRLDLYSGNIDVVNRGQNGDVVEGAFSPEVTPDGRYVVFESTERELVPGSTGIGRQIYVKDMVSGAIAMASTTVNGTGGNNEATAPQISDDGQFIVFNTGSALISADTNGYDDVYRVSNPVYAWAPDLDNDTFVNSPESEAFNGEEGMDSVVFSGEYANYSLSKASGSFSIGLLGETDQLPSIERLRFWDKSIALDTEGNALKTLEFIGVIAPSLQADLGIRGVILEFFDQGYSMESLCQLALDVGLISAENTALATTVYQNVLGGEPSQDMTSALVGYIEQHGDANFLATVAGLNLNVDLVGLQLQGMAYT